MKKIKVKFREWNCIAVFHKYQNNDRTAIEIVEEETGESVAMASVNLSDLELAPNTIAIKNYSENGGMVKALLEAGIIGKCVDLVISGHVSIGIYELLKTE